MDQPAFPVKKAKFSMGGSKITEDWNEGMTLRQWYAGQALAGMLAHSRGNPPHGYQPTNESQSWHEAISEESFQIADKMIKAGK